MRTSFYFRSPVLSFWDLSFEEQIKVGQEMDYLSPSELENESFVIDSERSEILPLSMFMRIDKPGIFCGVYGISAFSAYFIALSKCGEDAVIAYKYS
jgi:hypothetical protein